MNRPLRVLLLHPGASWSTADVEAGLRFGLQQHGVGVMRYRLDVRFERSKGWLYSCWRKQRKFDPNLARPTSADAVYHASCEALTAALRHQVDVVIVVSAMLVHPDVLIMMKRAGLRVVAIFTETPYDLEQELAIASIVDGCWTIERSSVDAFRAVNPNSGFLAHAWHPDRHRPDITIEEDVPAHDVVFVGSGFPERIAWFNAIDWTGIDLGLYGSWKGLGLKKSLTPCIRGAQVDNPYTAQLYRQAKIGLNLYRDRNKARVRIHAESLSPRAYELAACGAFHLSDYRSEVAEVFGDLVPTFRTPQEAEALMRQWLPNVAGRAVVAAQLPAAVAGSSWVERSAQVIGDLQTLLAHTVAA